MTSDRLTDLLVARLVRDHGRSKHHWRRLIGPIRIYSRETHPHCNWAAYPHGSHQEVSIIESLLDEFRLSYSLLAR